MTPRPPLRATAAAIAALALAGCASTAIDANFAAARRYAGEQLGAEPQWLTTDEARSRAQAEVDRLLAEPLAVDDAVRIALATSPALQALLADRAAESAEATQSARLPNPVFTFERLVRREAGARDLDIGRMLGISLGDLLLWPARARLAGFRQQRTQLELAGDVVQAALEARRAWVRAVAAAQAARYFEQVQAAAEAGSELARRMQAVGNYSRLQRAREQTFAADAAAQLARSRQAELAAREALVRALGLADAQAERLRLPERLPDLPAAARDERSVAQAAIDGRIDLRLARAQLGHAAQSQRLGPVVGWVDGFHIAAVRNSETGRAPQRGVEVELPLPVFDFGDALRAGAQARYMAQLQRVAQLGVDARSQLRERYAAYRTAHDLARHYRDEVVPLRKSIADENLLRYNGMLIGVFELLADAREQVASVVQAIDAERDFWLADAALQAALIGRPAAAAATQAASLPAPAAGH